MITHSTIEQIKNRIDVVDVVGEFVKLKRRGANYLGLCPFHGEKTPSFTVSPSKEIYKCFGCGKSGNAITFLMEHEKYSYVEALRWLAKRYNIEVEETEVSAETREHLQVADSLYIVKSFASKYFSDQLWNTDEGRNIALSYLEERGFNKSILQKFQVGYSPNEYDAFTQTAIHAQYNPELLIKSGLTVRNHNNKSLRDNYRGRIIFPVHNIIGKVIGFGARVIGKSDFGPKYINTPENEIYVKSKILYGTYFARQAIDKADECLLVEGYTDVISLAQAGVENVVASSGTSLTIEQLRLIKKYTNNITIVYDGDAAGIKAALRGLDMALEEAMNVRLVMIPDGEDPDSYIRKVGEKNFKEFVDKNKKDFIFFQLDTLMNEAGDDIHKKNDAVNKIAETISKINKAEDFTKQQEYIQRCASMLKIDERGLINLVNKYTREKIRSIEKKTVFDQQEILHREPQNPSFTDYFKTDDSIQERNLLRVLLEYGLKPWNENYTIADYIFSEIELYPLSNEKYIRLFQAYRDAYYKGALPDTKTMMYEQDTTLFKIIVDMSIFPYELSKKWKEMSNGKTDTEEESRRNDVEISLLYYKLRKVKMMMDDVQKELEVTKDENKIEENLHIHIQLKETEKQLVKKIGAVIVK